MLLNKGNSVMEKIYTLDTTLRDGLQAQTVSFSLKDKLNIIGLLDKLGVDFIEVGNPAFGKADEEFFKKLESVKTVNSKLITFTPTCRNDTPFFFNDGIIANVCPGTSVIFAAVVFLPNLLSSSSDSVSPYSKSFLLISSV